MHNWSRWKLYPLGIFMVMPRFLFAFVLFLIGGAVAKLCYFGCDIKRPLPYGLRRLIFIYIVNKLICRLILFACNCSVEYTQHEEKDVDYSKYLGPNWRESKFTGKNVPLMISNHVGFFEYIFYMAYCPRPPGFVASHFIKEFAIGGFYTEIVQSEYVNRTLDKEALDKRVEEFKTRAEMVEKSDEPWGPLCFFAEGTATNGENLNRFRRGAFAPLRPMHPCWFRYHWSTVSPDYAALRGFDYGFLLVCMPFPIRTEVHHLPVFVPNDYLFTEYAKTIEGHETMEKWEIYAHAVRDLIKREGNFGDNYQPNRDKVSLQQFLWGKKDEITINDKTYYWPPRPSSGSGKDDKKDK